MIRSILNWLFGFGNEETIKDWETKFPGKCIVCSYQAFGYREGLTDDPTPPPHNCTYKKETHETAK